MHVLAVMSWCVIYLTYLDLHLFFTHKFVNQINHHMAGSATRSGPNHPVPLGDNFLYLLFIHFICLKNILVFHLCLHRANKVACVSARGECVCFCRRYICVCRFDGISKKRIQFLYSIIKQIFFWSAQQCQFNFPNSVNRCVNKYEWVCFFFIWFMQNVLHWYR